MSSMFCSAMNTTSPQDKYLALAANLQKRIAFAERILSLGAPPSQAVETVCLQGRKALETIAYMCLVATERGLGPLGVPRDAKQHWNAEAIFRSLKKKSLNVLPSPSKMTPSSDYRFKATFIGIPENRLTYDELIALYRLFHRGLHEPNPYVTTADDAFYVNLIPELLGAVDRIKRFVWVHYIGIKGQGYAVDLYNTHGLTVVLPLTKTSDTPDDLVGS